MHPIYPKNTIQDWEKHTLKKRAWTEIQLMELAATRLAFAMLKEPMFKNVRSVGILTGPGNNGGDGLVIARWLDSWGYHVTVFYCKTRPNGGSSGQVSNTAPNENFLVQKKKLKNSVQWITLENDSDVQFITEAPMDIYIDAIFGFGYTPRKNPFFEFITTTIQLFSTPVIAIDLPSGLPADALITNNHIISANLVFTFQSPKLSLLLPEHYAYINEWKCIPIDLDPEFVKMHTPDRYLLEPNDLKKILKKRNPFAHKGTCGSAYLIMGSYGMGGAALLATQSCLRAGAGKVFIQVPGALFYLLQTNCPEAICHPDPHQYHITSFQLPDDMQAVAIGCGLGKVPATIQFLNQLLDTPPPCPLIFDADALNILADHPDWLLRLPSGSILTPHPGEFDRLFPGAKNSLERLELQEAISKKYQIYILLKGRYTSISTPQGITYFNATGNPGMATAGSGDVLTGIIAGFCTQGYTQLDACILGSGLHGIAGDIAVQKIGAEESLIASDLIQYLGKAFQSLKLTTFHD